MKVVIVSIGTRGDVQPSLVLGLALLSRGHEVVMATEERLRPLVEEMSRGSAVSPPSDDDDAPPPPSSPPPHPSKLSWRLIEGDEAGAVEQPHVQEMLANGRILKMMKASAEWKSKFDEASIMRSYVTALEGADVVVAGPLCLTRAMCVAEKMGCGFASLIPGPTLPTSEFPLWVLPVPCSCLNRWTYKFLFDALWRQEKKGINDFRKKELGLPPMTTGPLGVIEKHNFPCLVASSRVTCGPKMTVPADYPPYATVGGFVFPPDDAIELDRRLVDFVESSSSAAVPIVYLGWGSMPAPDPARMIRLARGLCDAASCRGVLVAGWSATLDPSDERCASAIREASQGGVLLVTKSARHSYLLPRCAAIAHHCGIGTCAAALRSGVPQIACPVMVDQPHNAKLLVRLGVAAGIVPFGKLSVERLAVPLRRILDERGDGPLCAAARDVAEKIVMESEGNLGRYAEAVEGAARFPPAPTAGA
jgi:sterol 3beta-glucosyltransferase